MNVIHTGQTYDGDLIEVAKTRGSIFLAGPTPRIEQGNGAPPSWRPDALNVLDSFRFDGIVYVPEHPPTGAIVTKPEEQWTWEFAALDAAHVIAFWVPREMNRMPALTTNIEFGRWYQSGKVVFGAPNDAVAVAYMKFVCEQFKIPVANTLEATMHHAVLMNTLGLRDAALALTRKIEDERAEKERRRAQISP